MCQQADKLNQQRPDVRTIDSFQGQERDVIVFSAVRASNADDHVSAGLGAFDATVSRDGSNCCPA